MMISNKNKISVKNYVSKKHLVIIFCLSFIWIPYLIVWLLFGEFNLLKLNWFKVSTESNDYVFNLNIFYIFLGIICFSLLLFIIFFNAFKLLKLNSMPFIIMSHAIGVSAIVTGLIPYNDGNFTYIIISRFLIVISIALLFFFLTNFIINKIMLSSRNQYDIYREYKEEELESKKINNDIDNLIKDKDEKDYIEIEKE